MDDRVQVLLQAQTDELLELIAGAHRRSHDRQLKEEDAGQFGRRGVPAVWPAMTSVPPGFNARIEWPHVSFPTVSITTSNRSDRRFATRRLLAVDEEVPHPI